MAHNAVVTTPDDERAALADCVAILIDDIRRKRAAEKLRRDDAQGQPDEQAAGSGEQ